MTRKRMFISGGNGFIGRNIREALGGEYEIAAPGRETLDLLDAESVRSYFKGEYFDVLVHCANVGGTRFSRDSDVLERNLSMFFNLEAARASWGRMIAIGSGAEYDRGCMHPKMREDEFGASVPQDEYGRYKYEISRFAQKSEEDIAVLRVFGCYGRYEDYGIRFVSNNICRAIFSRPLRILNQDVRFDYVCADDLARAIGLFARARTLAHRHYNVTPDRASSLSELARIIQEIDGNGLEIRVGKEGMGREYSGDNSRFKEEFGTFAFTPHERAIGELYGYYRERRGDIDLRRVLEHDRD